MNELLKFCVENGINCRVEQDEMRDGLTLRFDRLFDNYHFRMYISRYELTDANAEYGDFLIQKVITQMALKKVNDAEIIHDIEAILTRADAMWQDDIMNFRRIVISQNIHAPLTTDEQNLIRNMWVSQGIRGDIIFKVRGESNEL